jgi:MFS family permease
MEKADQLKVVASTKPSSGNVGDLRAAPRKAWAVVAMLTAFMAVNFMDKAVVGLAAVPIMKDLGLTHEEFGKLGSAFFLFFSVSAAIGGFLANRISTKLLLGGMVLVWALLQLPMIAGVGFMTLVVCRTLLGFGEGPAYPIAIHALYKWFRNDQRTFPASIMATGTVIGSGVAAPLMTWIILNYSWHAAFGFLGCVGIVWVLVWWTFGEEGPESQEKVTQTPVEQVRIPYTMLVFSRTVIGVMLASFSSYWALTLFVVWLPAFLVKGVGYSAQDAGWIVMVPSSFQVVASVAIGYLSQRMLGWGFSTRVARGLLGGGLVALGGVCMIGLSLTPKGPLEILFVLGSFSMSNLMFNLGDAAIGEITPPAQRGAMLGINQAIFSTAGLAAPWVLGHIVDLGTSVEAGFRYGFTVSGLLILAGGLLGVLLINPAKDRERLGRKTAERTFRLNAAA